ncbi:S15A3 protein, partial [Brachypteracias leptosomus]|nr:S15A3 protein [Brachypteracias leptosomus]
GERAPLVGGPPLRGHRGGCVALLVVGGLERVALVAISTNLGLYLSTTLGWGGGQGAFTSLLFLAASHLLSPVGGWLGDVYLGCHGTLVLSFSLSLLVASLLPVITTLDGRLSLCGQPPAPTTPNCSWNPGGTCSGHPPKLYCGPTIYSTLLVLALGFSSIRANLGPFGADQVRNWAEDAPRRFFNWFYWSINVGAAFSLLLVAFVQQNISLLVGYLIPIACLALALLIFLLATPKFITKPPRGSQVSAIIKLALKSWGCARLGGTRISTRRWEVEDPLPNSRAQPGAPSLKEDLANFKVLAQILPTMLIFIPHWMVYSQVQSTYYLQGLHLSIPSTFQSSTSTSQGYTFPGAWLLLPHVLILLALVPLKDQVIDPFLARHQLLPSLLQQMALGMFFSLMSILTAGRTQLGLGFSIGEMFGGFSTLYPHPTGILEQERWWHLHHNQTVPQLVGQDLPVAATLPIWWQLPQYLLLGTSEIFTSIPALEFSYTEAPEAMKGAIMGLFFFITGLGSLLGLGLWTLLDLPTHGWTSCPRDDG